MKKPEKLPRSSLYNPYRAIVSCIPKLLSDHFEVPIGFPYSPLHIPSVHFIFHVLFDLSLQPFSIESPEP